MKAMFQQIIGYDAIKQELSTIIGWYQDSNINPQIRLPRGVLLVGDPGQGKTLFMRAIQQAAVLPTYSFVNDKKQEAATELRAIFETASQNPQGAIILIDELDTLLKDNPSIMRCLKELMDGLSPQNRVLFIASANDAFNYDDPLSRPGRFDRTIWLSYPNEQERDALLTYFLSQHGKNISKDELDYFVELTTGCSNALLSAVVTDACLRNHGKTISWDMLETSYSLLCFNELPYHEPISAISLTSCVHEIGHAILVDHYQTHYILRCVSMRKKRSLGGACYSTVKNVEQNQEVDIEGIEIQLGGFLANQIVLGIKDNGSGRDLRNARLEARRLINSYGYRGVDKVLREYDPGMRNESWLTCLRNERLATKLIRQCERRASRIIQENKDVILQLAKELQRTGALSGKQVQEILAKAPNRKRLHA